MRRWLYALAILSGLPPSALAEDLRPAVKPMMAQSSFAFTHSKADKVIELRQAASGIACWARDGGGQRCLIAFDEGASARFATISETSYQPDPSVVVVRSDAKEVDAEGVARSDGYAFIVGSHAMKRKIKDGECKPNPDSAVLVRYDVEQSSGRLLSPPKAGFLRASLEISNELKKHLDKCLNKGVGLDIEGVAYLKNTLWFGLRGPTDGKQALLFAVDSEAIFDASKSPVAGRIRRVEVGDGRAIRDMQAVGNDLLLLVGPDDREGPQGYGFVLWNEANGKIADWEIQPLGEVVRSDAGDNCADKEVKPEGLSVADPNANPWRVLVVSDGLCDGGPMWFDLKR